MRGGFRERGSSVSFSVWPGLTFFFPFWVPRKETGWKMTVATGGSSLAFVGDLSRQASFHASAQRWMPLMAPKMLFSAQVQGSCWGL